jgi:serine phosphatase RsbU (regulator of sigma subunit)/CHASE3 domain sensor protein/anti-sigma regulatory factor (Ser/Thr protein kinase)
VGFPRRWLSPSRIRTQTILLSVVPAAFLLILLGLALLIQSVTVASADWAARSEKTLAQSERVSQLLNQASRGVSTYVSKHDPKALRDYRAAAQAMPTELGRLIALADSPNQRERAKQVASSVSRGMALIAAYLHLQTTGQAARARALVAQPSTQALGAEIERDAATFDNEQRKIAIAHTFAIRSSVRRYEWYLIATCILGIFCSLYMTFRFGFSIVQRLRLLAQSAQRLGSGAVSEPIEGSDEIAILDRVYHAMTRRIQREHAAVSVLQKALLPQDLPKMPGLRIDTAYAPAAKETAIGGDWYDVFALTPTCVGISVGDVAGHGLHAASVMGTARQAIRTAAYINAEPASVLYHVNRVACADSDTTVITAFFSTLDMNTGILRYAVAGHPLPLLMKGGHAVEMLEGEGLMLGIQPNVQYKTFETKLEIGSGLLLYTDGIVEANRDYLRGMEALQESFRTAFHGRAQNVALAIQQKILSHELHGDDAAILFVGVTELGKAATPLRQVWDLDAKDEHAAHRVKRAVLWHLGELPGERLNLSDAEVIVGELISNVARHTRGQAQLTLESQDGVAVLRVCDQGEPFALERVAPDLYAESGRGLLLVCAMSPEVSVERTSDGNCIRAVLPIL